MWGISCLDEKLLACQEGHYSLLLVCLFVAGNVTVRCEVLAVVLLQFLPFGSLIFKISLSCLPQVICN
jgi:hypothetical protein